jgi:anti-sigma B factor antagonist
MRGVMCVPRQNTVSYDWKAFKMHYYEDMLDINVERVETVTVVELIGSMDSVTASDVEDQVLPLVEASSKILLDMSRVTYLSSAGLRTLLLLYRRIREHVGQIALAGLTEEVRDVMSITGFLDFFSTYEDRHHGLKALA